MKINKSFIKKAFGIAFISLVFIGCQDMDRPELGTYPTDIGNYTPKDGETLYSPLENIFFVNSITGAPATKVGIPVLGNPKVGTASYKGADNSYISYPITDLFGKTDLSFSFWYKADSTQERAGIVVVGNPSAVAISTDNSRKFGFRLFREGTVGLKINVGTPSGESWNTNAKVIADTWTFITVVMTTTQSKIYINGALASTADFTGPVDFTGCPRMVIGSGVPTFDYWGHKSDTSLYDDFRVFNKALSNTEILALYTAN